jgi:hypothetical protein
VGNVNRLKKADNSELWKQAKFKFGPYLLAYPPSPDVRSEHEPQTDYSPAFPENPSTPVETPIPDRIDADYRPPDTPILRREVQTSRTQPPLTRLRAKNQPQDNVDSEVRQ